MLKILFLLFVINFIFYVLITDITKGYAVLHKDNVNFKLVTDFPSLSLNITRGYLFINNHFNIFNNKTLVVITKSVE